MSIILIKNNKGGVGKSWITLQLGCGIQFATEKKVLILTSDNQNNILEYAGIDKNKISVGIEDWLKNKTGEVINLRKNLDFIPIKTSYLNTISKNDLKELFEVFKSKYEYILIDSTPALHLDTQFIELADKVVVPGFADKVTLNSITSLLDQVNIDKVKSVIINRFTRTKKEKEYFNGLKEILNDFEIQLVAPISQSAVIGDLIDKGKTIWESNSKKVKPFQNIFAEVIEVLVWKH